MSALLRMLRKRLAVTWLGWAFCGLALVAIPVTNWLTLNTAMGQLRFAAMDSRDSFYLANLGDFETSQSIHDEMAKMAAETIFSRNPDGYDYPERMERLFNPETTALLKKTEGADAEIFRSRQIHQKLEIGKVREINVDNSNALVSVDGQLLRTGTFNEQIVPTSRNVTVFLKLKINNDMALNGRYPLVVVGYETRFE